MGNSHYNCPDCPFVFKPVSSPHSTRCRHTQPGAPNLPLHFLSAVIILFLGSIIETSLIVPLFNFFPAFSIPPPYSLASVLRPESVLDFALHFRRARIFHVGHGRGPAPSLRSALGGDHLAPFSQPAAFLAAVRNPPPGWGGWRWVAAIAPTDVFMRPPQISEPSHDEFTNSILVAMKGVRGGGWDAGQVAAAGGEAPGVQHGGREWTWRRRTPSSPGWVGPPRWSRKALAGTASSLPRSSKRGS